MTSYVHSRRCIKVRIILIFIKIIRKNYDVKSCIVVQKTGVFLSMKFHLALELCFEQSR